MYKYSTYTLIQCHYYYPTLLFPRHVFSYVFYRLWFVQVTMLSVLSSRFTGGIVVYIFFKFIRLF